MTKAHELRKQVLDDIEAGKTVKKIRLLEAELTTLKAENEWQPIETAPKDEFVLLAGPSGYTTIETVFTTGRMCSDYHAGRWIDHANDDLTDWGFNPTHWMTLPKPPAAPQPEPNRNRCAGCSPDNCSGCGTEPVCEWVKADGANYLRQKWHKDYVAVEGDKLYTTPQPDRTAELEAALKVAKAALNRAADKFHDYAEIHAAKEASPENDLKVERNLMLSSDMDKALAKINEVLK